MKTSASHPKSVLYRMDQATETQLAVSGTEALPLARSTPKTAVENPVQA